MTLPEVHHSNISVSSSITASRE